MTEDEAFALAEKLESFPSSEEMSDGLRRTQRELFDEQGKLRDGMPPEEGKKRGPIYTNVSYDSNVGTPTEEEIDQMTSEQQRGFDANKEAEHTRRIMTSRQVPMRDAWSILKNDFFNPPRVPCAKCGKPTEPMMYYGSNQMGPQDNTLCEECEDPRYNTLMQDQ